MVSRGAAPPFVGAVWVSDTTEDFVMSVCDMARKDPAKQIVVAVEVEFQGFLHNFGYMSAGELKMTNLEAAEYFSKLGCDINFLEPSCGAVTADFSNSRCVDMRKMNKNGIAPDENEKAALPNSASNIFCEEAK
jgi:hypothetical protein